MTTRFITRPCALARASFTLGILAALLGTLGMGTARAERDHQPGIAPPNSNAYGQSLAEWLETWGRWYNTGADPTQSRVGSVQLMPLPAGDLISGSGSPSDPALYRGRLEINLPPGTPFVLPEFTWTQERYNNGTPDDPPIADAVALAGAHPLLQIDGHTVLSDRNKGAYYVPVTPFDPIVVYPAPTSYGSIAALSFQGVGVVGLPLAEGVHVIHLYEPIIIPAGAYVGLPDGVGVIYDNTWVVTVARPPRIVPPDRRYAGRSYSEWSAQLWQWGLELPVQDAAGNPLPHPYIDAPGFDVTEGQSGPVWFLAAPFGNVERTCTIPEGKALFLALIDGEASSLEDPPFFGANEADQRAAAKVSGDQMINVFCTVDGVAVDNIASYRVVSPQYTFTAPTPWIFGPTGGTGTSVADGYYVLVGPLPKGQHTLHFGGALDFDPANAFINMTYHLTVTDNHGNHED